MAAKSPRIAFVHSSGTGHLMTGLRIAAALSARGCNVTFVVPTPTVSASESALVDDLLSSHPSIQRIDLPLHLPFGPDAPKGDPFILHWGIIARTAALLPPLLSAASPLPYSALIVDIPVVDAFVPVAKSMGTPIYTSFISATTMLALCAAFPAVIDSNSFDSSTHIQIPGLPRPIPKAWIPPTLLNPDDPFTHRFVATARALTHIDGILMNTFETIDSKALAALNSGLVLPGFAPVIPIGPLQPVHPPVSSPVPWLDAQPDKSVVFFCCGSRTTMAEDQIKEMALGLELSGWKFLCVLKTKIVDRDEDGSSIEELVGEGYLERVKDRGFVTSRWVDQEGVLKHRAVGGFISHCGWNSLMEAAMHAVPVLGWPQAGDQLIQAKVVEEMGMGLFVEKWGWAGKAQVVKADDIAVHVRMLMEDGRLRAAAERISREGAAAVAPGGSSDRNFKEFISKLRV